MLGKRKVLLLRYRLSGESGCSRLYSLQSLIVFEKSCNGGIQVKQDLKRPVVYSVYYPKRDLAVLFHGPLYAAKKSVFEKGKTVHKSGNAIISGVESTYEATVNRYIARWKLSTGSKSLQKTYPDRDGYYVITKSFSGNIIAKTVFEKGHHWVRSAYFEQGNTGRPAVVFSPGEKEEEIQMLLFCRDQHMFERLTLYPCPVVMGTEFSSILDAQVGVPELYLATSNGDFCYYREEEAAQKRRELLDKLQQGKLKPEPVWKQEPPFAAQWQDENEKLDIGENYRYRGGTDEKGERHGRGRTEQINGMTAYEGEYEHGRRSGKGVYYYSNGAFCYYGGWLSGRRSGVGVTVKKNSDAIHVGNWDAGTLSGFSAVFEENGALKQFGVVTDGELQGVKIHFFADGNFLIGIWEGNTLTGSGSIFSAGGQLLYCGGLEEGKRSGQGVSFKEDGTVDCVGKWKKDICHEKYCTDQ